MQRLCKECPQLPAEKERPQLPPTNDYHSNTAGRGRTAKTRQSEQGALKEEGIDLLVMPDD